MINQYADKIERHFSFFDHLAKQTEGNAEERGHFVRSEYFGTGFQTMRSFSEWRVLGTYNIRERYKEDYFQNHYGIRGNDGVICEDSMIRVESKSTGIRTNSEKGYVVISGGKCQVIAGENTVFSDDYVTIHDCDYEFSSADEEVRCYGVKELEEKV